jgi:phage portal protein BeeE
MSPLLAGLKSLQLDDFAIEAWLKSLENEGAKGIISPNHPDKTNWLSPEQVKATEAKVQEKIHGYENKNKVVVSGMPLQYTQIGLSPDALNIINSLEKAGNDLCDLWGVPAVLFDPNPTYQNQKEAGARFIRDVILPYLNKEEDALNRWLVEPFRKERNYLLAYDTSLFDELRITMQDREYLERILTLNEMRIIEGYDEIENPYANEVFIAQGKIPLSDYGFGE